MTLSHSLSNLRPTTALALSTMVKTIFWAMLPILDTLELTAGVSAQTAIPAPMLGHLGCLPSTWVRSRQATHLTVGNGSRKEAIRTDPTRATHTKH